MLQLLYKVLKVVKEELVTREKIFSSEPNVVFIHSFFLLENTKKFKEKADTLCLFCNESHNSPSCGIVETRRNISEALLCLLKGGTNFKELFE